MKIIFLVLILFSVNLFSKDILVWNYEDSFFRGIEFTPDKKNLEKYNYNYSLWLPILEITAFNLTLTTFNRYILQRESSHLTFESVKENFRHGFDWDTDALSTNFFMHPIQGSIYFNTARSNGYSYQSSLMVAVMGSLQWEFFMEVMPPSINDLLVTSVSGAMLGELFYRITSLIIDESESGFVRFVKEFSSGLIAPGRFFNRLATGRVSRSLEHNLYAKKKYRLNMGFGVNKLSEGNSIDFYGKSVNLITTLNFKYGIPFSVKKLKLFRFFDLNILLNIVKNKREQFLSSINVDGIIYGMHHVTEDKHHLIISIDQYFDYFNTHIYKIAALKFGPSLLLRSAKSSILELEMKFNLTFVPMAGILSTYSQYYVVQRINKSKQYNTSWGVSSNLSIKFITKYFDFEFDYLFWGLRTYKIYGAGALGTEFSSMLRPRIKVNLTREVVFQFQYLNYYNIGKYELYPDTKKYINEIRAILSYNF